MTRNAQPATGSLDPFCPSCGVPGELQTTRDGQAVLLESNDPSAPLRADEVPHDVRWTVAGYYAQRLPEDSAPSAPCQVEHAAVCPSRPAAPISPALHRRRRLNEARRRRGEELYGADPAYTDD